MRAWACMGAWACIGACTVRVCMRAWVCMRASAAALSTVLKLLPQADVERNVARVHVESKGQILPERATRCAGQLMLEESSRAVGSHVVGSMYSAGQPSPLCASDRTLLTEPPVHTNPRLTPELLYYLSDFACLLGTVLHTHLCLPLLTLTPELLASLTTFWIEYATTNA
jgi:hypothetical protein